MQRLGHILSEPRYLQAAERTIRLFYSMMSAQSSGYYSLLTALDETLFPPIMIILRSHSDEVTKWQHMVQCQFPHILVLTLPAELINLPLSLSKAVSTEAAAGSVSAWVCTVAGCMPEITNLQDLLQICKVQGRISNLL